MKGRILGLVLKGMKLYQLKREGREKGMTINSDLE